MKLIYQYTFLILFALITSCTNNPFGSDDISSETRQIQGTVKLSDGTSPDGVYVWLDGTNSGTWTDTDGRFTLSIKPTKSSVNLTGSFKLYFYLANYKIETADIAMHNGELIYSKGDINNAGELNTTINLVKQLSITAGVERNHDILSFSSFEVKFQATNNPIEIKFPHSSEGPLSLVYIQKLDTEKKIISIVYVNALVDSFPLQSSTITTEPVYWVVGYNITKLKLSEGRYKLYPYFFIQQENIPEQMMQSLGENVYSPTIDYMNIPIKIDGGIFKVGN